MNNAKIIYFFALVTVVIVILLFLDNIFPIAMIAAQPETKYIIDLVSIITGVGGLFALLYFFRFAPIRRMMDKSREDIIEKLCTARIIAWFVLMLTNIILYFEAMGVATNPKYAIIFLAIAYVFCWPTKPTPEKR